MPGTYKDVKDTSLTAQFKVLENHKSKFLFELLPHPKSLSNREGLDSYPSPMERGRGEVFILAWTTTPWTLPANSALTVGKNINYVLIKTFNPYTFLPVNVVLAKELVGKYFTEKGKDGDFNGFEVSDKKLIPWTIISEFKGSDLDGIEYEQLLPYVQPETAAFRVIIGDFVTTEDGTGVVHTSPTFGADDFRVAQQHGIPSIMVKDETGKDVPIVDKRGRFVKEITDFALEYVKEAYLSDEEKEVERIKQAGGGPHREKYLSVDERIAIKLKTENKAFNVQRYEHTYPHCWRTDKPILYYPLDSWFIRTTAMKDKLVELNKTINWKPESTGTGRFGNWLENLVDWNLSRSRYWGTPLPIWRSEDNEEVCIGSVEELINGLKHALKDDVLNEEQRAENEKFINAYYNSKKSKESSSVVESGVEENITWEHFIYQSNYKDWSNLKNLARENRKNQTQAENIIWQEVRNSKLGFKFRRQHSIDTFIVDFICIEKKLIVEIDGDIHNETIEYDEMRTKFLNLRGFEVIRFSNNEVLTNIRGVIGEINIALKPRRSDGRPKSLSTEEGLDLITVLHPSPVERGRGEVFDLHRPFVDEVYLVSPSGKIMQRELDLIDVWFDSGAMPFAQWHYPFENKEIFDANYPADFISEGVDQTRGWFFTLHAISGMLYDSVAFKNVVSTGLVLDKNGNKMSKRLGNAVDPFETLGKYGADPTRWYMITNAEPWDNLKFNLEGIGEVQRKFFGTLSNTYNFYALYANLDKYKMTEFDRVPYEHLPELDRWIQSKLYTLIKEVGEQYDDYNPTKAGRLIQDFVCDQLSNWYVRLCRRRFWQGELTQDKRAAYETLQHCLVTVAQLMSPIAPFYGDWLYKSMTDCIREEAIEKNTPLRHESVHFTDWHTYEENWVDKNLEASMDLAQSISSLIHSLRKTHKIKVRQPLQRVLIPVLSENTREQIRHVEEIIKSEVNIKSIEYIDDDSATSVGGFLKKKVKPNFKTLGPKYGKDMKEVGNFINSMSAEQLKELEKNGELPTHSGTGGEPLSSFTHLKLEDVEIQTEDVPGWLVASDNGITVALDITISDELRQEGIARDFVNRIQNYRKDNGFEVTNKINIQLWNNNQALANAIDANREYISQEVQALSLKIFEEYPLGEKPTNAVEIEMDEFMLVLSVDVEK